jgi:hypothetical protein
MPTDRQNLLALTTALGLACGTMAWADQPLSAIDWLSQSLVSTSTTLSLTEPPVTPLGLQTNMVTVQKSIKRLKELEQMAAEGSWGGRLKKEIVRMERERKAMLA